MSDRNRTAGVRINSRPDVYARLERIKALWREVAKTPRKSKRYQELADEIRAEAAAYLAGVEAAIGTQRRKADRRQFDTAQERIERRQSARRH